MVPLLTRYGTGQLPQNGSYTVSVAPSQPAFFNVISKASSGFNIVLTPPGVGGAAAQLATGGAISTSSATITMAAAIPAWVVAGLNVYDLTNGKQIGTVLSISGTTLTLTANAANAGSSGDILQFGQFTLAAGTFDVVVVG